MSMVMKIASLHKCSPRQIFASIAICYVLIAWIGCVFGQSTKPNAIGPEPIFEHPDFRFIESLLKKELFEVAMETCRTRQKLASGSQSEASAQWAMLEMHTVAAKIASDPRILDEPALAANLLAANQAILDRESDSSRWLWLRHQQQWCRWLVLQRLQVAYIAVPTRKAIRDWSLSTIRECLAELETIQSEIQTGPSVNTKPNTKSAATMEQWSHLTNDATLLQTDFLLLRAHYYPANSTERLGAATEMLTAIEKAERRISTDWPERPNIDLAKYNALIHMNRPQDALDGLTRLAKQLEMAVEDKPKRGNRWQLRIAALSAQACRNLGDISESNRWIESVGGWTSSPEMAIEYFANLIAAPTGKNATETQIASSLKIKEEIGVRFGNYWQQRADAVLLENNVSSTSIAKPPNATPSGSVKVELLWAEAKQLLSAKRTDEAIEKLGQAEVSAANAGDETNALEMAIKAAAVLSYVGRKEEAEGEFHRAAMTYPRHAKAPDAATMSVVGFVKAISFDATGKPLSAEEESAELKQQIYRGRLMDIVNTWPASKQASEASKKLDRLFLATNQIPELLALWCKRLGQTTPATSLPSSSSSKSVEFDAALSRFGLVCAATQDAWMDKSIYTSDTMKKIRSGLEELRSQLTEHVEPSERTTVSTLLAALSETGRWPSTKISKNTNSEPKSSAALAFLSTMALPSEGLSIEDLFAELDKANLDEITRLSLTWCSTELTFQQLSEKGLIGPVNQKEVNKLRYCVDRMTKLEQQERSTLGTWQATQLGRSLRLYLATIQCWSGDEVAGVSALRREIAAETKIPWWTYRSARLFQTLPSQRTQAMDLFRQLAKGFPPGSEAWLEARARTAQTMRLQGEPEKAKELMDLVFATHPSAAQQWASRFEQ